MIKIKDINYNRRSIARIYKKDFIEVGSPSKYGVVYETLGGRSVLTKFDSESERDTEFNSVTTSKIEYDSPSKDVDFDYKG